MSFSKQKGFTLIELIVVIALMAVIATLFLANYNGLRGPRNLKIAQNLLATNIRKTQSYILSARNVVAGGTTPAKYYGLQFTANSTQYVIQSIDTNYNLNSALETVALPGGITISSIQYVSSSGVTNNTSSLQLAFASPYAKLLTYNAGADCTTFANLVAAVQNAGCVLTLSDRNTIITLRDSASSTIRTVTVHGASGTVESSP